MLMSGNVMHNGLSPLPAAANLVGLQAGQEARLQDPLPQQQLDTAEFGVRVFEQKRRRVPRDTKQSADPKQLAIPADCLHKSKKRTVNQECSNSEGQELERAL